MIRDPPVNQLHTMMLPPSNTVMSQLPSLRRAIEFCSLFVEPSIKGCSVMNTVLVPMLNPTSTSTFRTTAFNRPFVHLKRMSKSTSTLGSVLLFSAYFRSRSTCSVLRSTHETDTTCPSSLSQYNGSL